MARYFVFITVHPALLLGMLCMVPTGELWEHTAVVIGEVRYQTKCVQAGLMHDAAEIFVLQPCTTKYRLVHIAHVCPFCKHDTTRQKLPIPSLYLSKLHAHSKLGLPSENVVSLVIA